ncbi:hypothetical protein [Streptomyces scabiei]|uniref:hypothetical protein n=1 Tax=Streptomyces scabiei TaxID=1930 RepID=UPI001B3294A9|nr:MULTISPECIES: hypothetical protein [Streptomyces]MBP5890640.1 hypothetical protein [Streptomyces sp. LBUM 1481]MBP5920772.1 hypothetical protein [Streptomyces sp. LBUM 1483]MDX2538876.1 hypothetical protein [Streptomyces scabiei]MDX2801853.1 hypothetical protein [Streptomyces scabiei]MDX3295028.1 hypothetical protein [Streptomyces scabiei]
MPTHKMITIDGIRVRAEDEDRYRARTGGGAPAAPLTRALAEPEPEKPEEPAPAPLFDPSEHDAPGVLAHLATADETETARVLAAEAAGKNRKTIMGKDST